MLKSESRRPTTRMAILIILLALISSSVIITTRSSQSSRSVSILTDASFSLTPSSSPPSQTIKTTLTALTMPQGVATKQSVGAAQDVAASPGTPRQAPIDRPLLNGPVPIFWSDGDNTYRAVHFISRWDASTREWLQISPDLTLDNTPSSRGYGLDGITAIAHYQGVWYAGTLAGQVIVKLPGQAWSVLGGQLPLRTVTSLAILPGNTAGKLAALGYGGYGTATPEEPGHVFLTKDGGSSWTDVTGNLPDEPVQSLHFGMASSSNVLTVKMNNQWYVMNKPGQWSPLT